MPEGIVPTHRRFSTATSYEDIDGRLWLANRQTLATIKGIKEQRTFNEKRNINLKEISFFF